MFFVDIVYGYVVQTGVLDGVAHDPGYNDVQLDIFHINAVVIEQIMVLVIDPDEITVFDKRQTVGQINKSPLYTL
jgi:hypothetical protein